MGHGSACFHDADDTGVDLVFAVFFDFSLGEIAFGSVGSFGEGGGDDFDAVEFGGEIEVVGEGVVVFEFLDAGLFVEDFHAGEKQEIAFEVVDGDVGEIDELGKGVGELVAEGEKNDHLVGGDGEEMAAFGELSLDIRGTHVGLPGEDATRAGGKIKLFKDLAASKNFRGEFALGSVLRGPEAGGEHLNAELGFERIGEALVVEQVLAEGIHDVSRRSHVVEHALELGGELETTFAFEILDHAFFGIVRNGLSEKQAARKMVFIVFFENVFFLDEAEDVHDFAQHDLHLIFARSLKSLAEVFVDEQ